MTDSSKTHDSSNNPALAADTRGIVPSDGVHAFDFATKNTSAPDTRAGSVVKRRSKIVTDAYDSEYEIATDMQRADEDVQGLLELLSSKHENEELTGDEEERVTKAVSAIWKRTAHQLHETAFLNYRIAGRRMETKAVQRLNGDEDILLHDETKAHFSTLSWKSVEEYIRSEDSKTEDRFGKPDVERDADTDAIKKELKQIVTDSTRPSLLNSILTAPKGGTEELAKKWLVTKGGPVKKFVGSMELGRRDQIDPMGKSKGDLNHPMELSKSDQSDSKGMFGRLQKLLKKGSLFRSSAGGTESSTKDREDPEWLALPAIAWTCHDAWTANTRTIKELETSLNTETERMARDLIKEDLWQLRFGDKLHHGVRNRRG